MKKIITYLLLVVCATACTKSVNNPYKTQTQIGKPLSTHINGILENSGLVWDLGGSVLKIMAEPNLTCYSYQNGETPKPCNIFVAFNCTLSNPIDRYVKVEIVKNNMITNNRDDGNTDESSKMVIVIAPNTTKFTLLSGLTMQNNNYIPEGEFTILNVSWYKKVD